MKFGVLAAVRDDPERGAVIGAKRSNESTARIGGDQETRRLCILEDVLNGLVF